MMGWAERMCCIPKGYSSADNGAIHVHIIETLKLRGAERCVKKYAALVADVTNLAPYFEFVNCAKGLMGLPRRWRVTERVAGEEVRGWLAVWPKFHFFVADGFYLDNHASDVGGPVLHHGYKHRAWDPKAVHRTYFEDLFRCRNSRKHYTSRNELARRASSHVQPHFRACTATFSCEPLGKDDRPLPAERTCGERC